jgi:hypothetical protein
VWKDHHEVYGHDTVRLTVVGSAKREGKPEREKKRARKGSSPLFQPRKLVQYLRFRSSYSQALEVGTGLTGITASFYPSPPHIASTAPQAASPSIIVCIVACHLILDHSVPACRSPFHPPPLAARRSLRDTQPCGRPRDSCSPLPTFVQIRPSTTSQPVNPRVSPAPSQTGLQDTFLPFPPCGPSNNPSGRFV